MLDRTLHEQVLKNILRDIYTNPGLRGALAFKGGTCLYLFYGLDRFSVDLDFNLTATDFDTELLGSIFAKNLIPTDYVNKHFTWFWMGSYKTGSMQIKLEVSKRDYPDTYVNKDFYGVSVPTMSRDCMFAHKLCAITDRKNLQNRDLYDAHFMFAKNFEINQEIIQIRTGKTTNQYLAYLADFVQQKVDPKTILNGLGELVEGKQKSEIKHNLKNSLLFDLKSRLI